MNGRMWTECELAVVRERYADTATAEIAMELRRPLTVVYQKAAALGLRKSEAYLASPAACRLRRGDRVGAASRFLKGHVPANKGLRRPGWSPGRMKETQFKKGARTGAAQRNWRPVGTIAIDTEGYLRIKVREGRQGEASGFGNVRIWPLLNRYVWEQANGPIPPNHTVVFRDGDRGNCELGNLELVSRADLMRRNTIHNRYPEEMVKTIMLLGAVKRKLREKSEKHND